MENNKPQTNQEPKEQPVTFAMDTSKETVPVPMQFFTMLQQSIQDLRPLVMIFNTMEATNQALIDKGVLKPVFKEDIVTEDKDGKKVQTLRTDFFEPKIKVEKAQILDSQGQVLTTESAKN